MLGFFPVLQLVEPEATDLDYVLRVAALPDSVRIKTGMLSWTYPAEHILGMLSRHFESIQQKRFLKSTVRGELNLLVIIITLWYT